MRWSIKRMDAANQIRLLKEAGFDNRDIIDAKKQNVIDALVGPSWQAQQDNQDAKAMTNADMTNELHSRVDWGAIAEGATA